MRVVINQTDQAVFTFLGEREKVYKRSYKFEREQRYCLGENEHLKAKGNVT